MNEEDIIGAYDTGKESAFEAYLQDLNSESPSKRKNAEKTYLSRLGKLKKNYAQSLTKIYDKQKKNAKPNTKNPFAPPPVYIRFYNWVTRKNKKKKEDGK